MVSQHLSPFGIPGTSNVLVRMVFSSDQGLTGPVENIPLFSLIADHEIEADTHRVRNKIRLTFNNNNYASRLITHHLRQDFNSNYGYSFIYDIEEGNWLLESQVQEKDRIVVSSGKERYTSERLRELGINCVPTSIVVRDNIMIIGVPVNNQVVSLQVPTDVPNDFLTSVFEGKPIIPFKVSTENTQLFPPKSN